MCTFNSYKRNKKIKITVFFGSESKKKSRKEKRNVVCMTSLREFCLLAINRLTYIS